MKSRLPQPAEPRTAPAVRRATPKSGQTTHAKTPLQLLSEDSPQVQRLKTLQAKAGAAATVVQLGRNWPGGNPQGRGGKSKKYAHQGPRGPGPSKGRDDDAWRRSIARPKPKRRAAPQADPFAANAAPPRAPAPMMNPGPAPQMPQGPMQRPARIPLDPRAAAPDHVAIDMPPLGGAQGGAAREPRGMRERVKAKIGAGRTFGDAANTTGSGGAYFSGIEAGTQNIAGAATGIIGGAGVLLSGAGLLRVAWGMPNDTGRERVDLGLTVGMGLANAASGISGVIAGIMNLAGANAKDETAAGRASAITMALTEALNIALQLKTIHEIPLEDPQFRWKLAKAVSLILTSYVKMLGSIYVIWFGWGAAVVFAGALLSFILGAGKLLLIALRVRRASREADPDEIDLEAGPKQDPDSDEEDERYA